MADKKITDLPEIPAVADGDYLEIVDVSAGTSNKVKVSDLNRNISCKVIRLSSQSIPNTTWTAVGFGTEEWDWDNMHSTGTNIERITIQTAGKYRISANVNFEGSSSSAHIRCFRIVKNAAAVTIVRDNRMDIKSTDFHTTGKLDTLHDCEIGDYFVVEVWQNSGGSLDIVTTYTYPTEFMAELVS